jgi:uncharacterized protein (DUF1501 family)
MQHYNFNIMNRRSFLSTTGKAGILAALASITNVPGVLRQALADGIGANGKKVLFIWLRFGNDGLNSLIPTEDPSYGPSRPKIGIPRDPITSTNPNYYSTTTGTADFFPSGSASTYGFYPYAIRAGNGFAALHPSLKFLAPVYNSGDLAFIHRVAYPRQSRSHFDSQIYWENGVPNNNIIKDGIFYRTLIESGLSNLGARGVTIQNALPLIMRGSAAAMTNLTDPRRYDLLGIPSGNPTGVGDPKALGYIGSGNSLPYASKNNRDMLYQQYANLQSTLSAFANINFDETGNTFRDDEATDGDTAWASAFGGSGYYLFPTSNDKNGGWRRTPGGTTDGNKYVVDPGHQGFFFNLKAAALVLNHTDAVIAGTEIGGFDTHQLQINQNNGTPQPTLGAHANLQRAIGWALYGVRKYFKIYGEGGTAPSPGAQVSWDDLVVVTLSEFGRTTIENSDLGTDHAEAGLMFVAGGQVKGYGRHASGSGILNCSPSESGLSASLLWTPGSTGTMFGASSRYLSRNTDFRSVLGEVIRKHLGASQSQLNSIIPGYAVTGERLLSGGTSSIDSKPIRGEVGILA